MCVCIVLIFFHVFIIMENIGFSHAADEFYRYKMPKLVVKVETKGTKLVNITEVSKAIGRKPDIIMKFMSFKLSTGVKNDILAGTHTQEVLKEGLYKFISKFVQCYTCHNPETVQEKHKKKLVLVCKACGVKSVVDPDDKLTKYILKRENA